MKSLAHAEDAEEIRRRLRALRPESPRRWGRMSTDQMVCHLADAFRACLGEKAARDVSNPFRRTVLKWIALWAPMRWPPGIRTRPEMDQERGGTKPVLFASDVAAVLDLVDRVVAEPRLDTRTHPLFGRMSRAEWLRWGYLHCDHHLRQFGG
jgi:hypothetical protein